MTMLDAFLPPAAVSPQSSGFSLPLALIHVPPRLREVDAAWAEALAASFEDHGMDTPIVVRPIEDPQEGGPTHILVAGAHRITAARLLGWTSIKCVVRHLDDNEARLVEIDENLMRRELDPLDRGQFLKERKAVYERMHPTTKHGKAPKPRNGGSQNEEWQSLPLLPARFTAEVAEATGFSERRVRMDLQIADALDPGTVAIIRGTPHAGKQQSLLKLSRETNPAKQRTLASALRDGAKTFEAAKIAAGFEAPLSPENPQMRILAHLLEAWCKADAETRAAFLADIDAAIVGTSSLAKSAPPGKGRSH